MGVQVTADGGELVGIALDAVDDRHVSLVQLKKVLLYGSKAGPFGLMRMPGRRRVQGRVAGSAGIGPGAAQIKSFSAIGSKSARKCTELLLTRIACAVGS